MDYKYLANNFITKKQTLTEARSLPENKYSIPSNIFNGTEDRETDELAEEELNDANPQNEELPEENSEQPEDDNNNNPDAPELTDDEPVPQDNQNDAPDEQEPVDEEPADTNQDDVAENPDNTNPAGVEPNQNSDYDQNGDDPTSVIQDTPPEEEYTNSTEFSNDEMSGDGTETEDDMTMDAQETPGLKILSSISDAQYKLLNTELYEKFKTLISDIKSLIENEIEPLVIENPRMEQCKSIVHNNLISMQNDITNYLVYTWNSAYESNIVAYGVFMKRYKICVDIIYKLKRKKLK